MDMRAGEFASGGVGPHEIRRMPGSDVLVIANGGIATHPGSSRAKLNIPKMQPNLAYIEGGKSRRQSPGPCWCNEQLGNHAPRGQASHKEPRM